MSVSSEKYFERLLKFSHPHIHIYKLSQMDATSPSLLYSEVTEPRHTIFLPLCKVLPTGSTNTVLLEGHHLDGTIAFKFANARDQSQFMSIAQKSSEMYSMVNDAYQDVRFISAGGNFQECRTGSAVPNVCGVGLFIDYSKNGRSFTVRDIVPGSPAAACGLISVHDHFLKIGGVSVKHSFSTLEDVVDSIRGIEGTQVSLQFRKGSGPNAKSIYEVTLKRGPSVIAQESVAIQIGDACAQHKKDSSSFEGCSSNPDLSPQVDVTSQDESDVPSITNSKRYMIDKKSGAESLKEPLSSQNIQNSAFYIQAPANQFHPIRGEQYKKVHQSALFETLREPESFLDRRTRALPQDLGDLPDNDSKLSKYLQSFNSAKFSSGSTDVFQRPTLQGFATDLGMMLFPTHDHRYTVRSIGSNTPASRQNIMIGDVLWAVDRESVAFKSQAEVCKLLSRKSSAVEYFFVHFLPLHVECMLYRTFIFFLRCRSSFEFVA
jgi:C-terminal processing protease CtpA/Prc